MIGEQSALPDTPCARHFIAIAKQIAHRFIASFSTRVPLALSANTAQCLQAPTILEPSYSCDRLIQFDSTCSRISHGDARRVLRLSQRANRPRYAGSHTSSRSAHARARADRDPRAYRSIRSDAPPPSCRQCRTCVPAQGPAAGSARPAPASTPRWRRDRGVADRHPRRTPTFLRLRIRRWQVVRLWRRTATPAPATCQRRSRCLGERVGTGHYAPDGGGRALNLVDLHLEAFGGEVALRSVSRYQVSRA